MDREQQAQIVGEQKAGCEILDRLNTEEARRATFADRLASWRRIMSFAPYVREQDEEYGAAEVAARWAKIRQRYAERNQRSSDPCDK